MLCVPRRSGSRLEGESQKGERLVDHIGRGGRVELAEQVGVNIFRNLGGQEDLFGHRAFGHELIAPKFGSHLVLVIGGQAGHVLAEFLSEFSVQTGHGMPRDVAHLIRIAAKERGQPAFVFPLGLGVEQDHVDWEQTFLLFPLGLRHWFLLFRNTRGPFLRQRGY